MKLETRGSPKAEIEKRGTRNARNTQKRWLPGLSVFQGSDCSSLLTIPLHVFKEDPCKDEEPCSAGRMQALPFNEGSDTPPPKENSDSVRKVVTASLQFSSLSGTRLGDRGQDWGRFWDRSGCRDS